MARDGHVSRGCPGRGAEKSPANCVRLRFSVLFRCFSVPLFSFSFAVSCFSLFRDVRFVGSLCEFHMDYQVIILLYKYCATDGDGDRDPVSQFRAGSG